MTLDETLRALCEKHGLTAISLHVMAAHRPYANVHWECGGEMFCKSEFAETMEAALANAIHKANTARAISPEVPALEIEVSA